MNSGKREEDQKREEDLKKEEQKNAFINGQSPESVKKNPNPRANENLPEKEGNTEENTTVLAARSPMAKMGNVPECLC